MSNPNYTGFRTSAGRYRTDRDSHRNAYHWQRSDATIQDSILHPDTIREIMTELSKVAGDLAYTPEMQARIMTVLQQRFNSNIGNDVFVVPNYAVYDDPEIAAFYGVDTSQTNNIQTRKETFDEQKARLIKETARELEVEIPGLAQMMEHYRREDWARHGISDEAPYIHSDPDVTLFRNPGGGWCSMDVPIATSEKSNVLDMYEGQPEFTFPTPHPGWEVDVKGGYWDSLS